MATENRHVRLNIQDGGKTYRLEGDHPQGDGKEQTESVFSAQAAAGIKTLQIGRSSLKTARRTGTTMRSLGSSRPNRHRPRILYIEGEPKWEFKFIRRAIEPDQSLQLTSMLRTTQNKIYRRELIRQRNCSRVSRYC